MSRDLMMRGAMLAAFAALAGLFVGLIGHRADQGAGAWVIEAVLLGALFLALGYAVFLRPGRALADVANAADRLAGGELDVRAPDTGGPGAELTDSFNLMARRLQQLLGDLAAEHRRLEAVFAAATDGVVAVDADMSVRLLNPAAASILGTESESALNRPLIELARDYEVDALVRRVVSGEGSQDAVVITFGPRRIPLRAAAVPIRGGGDWAVLLVLADLTDVARVDQVRRDFLSNVSHELRTPLASIHALVETMEAGAVEPGEESAEFLRRVRLQVERITQLVNELLDLSRIESGALELRPEPVDLTALVVEAATLLRHRSETERVTLDGPHGGAVMVEGDHAALLRVVSNLLDNAIKYSRGGSVHVETRDEGDLAAVAVRDEGPGIPPAELPRLFERFYKSDASRADEGTGLGLAIVKHIVRVHGGTATVESREGEGATFTIRLPKVFVGVTPVPPPRLR